MVLKLVATIYLLLFYSVTVEFCNSLLIHIIDFSMSLPTFPIICHNSIAQYWGVSHNTAFFTTGMSTPTQSARVVTSTLTFPVGDIKFPSIYVLDLHLLNNYGTGLSSVSPCYLCLHRCAPFLSIA